jgi:diguanylate cyclase (GGDEF)-like protein
MLKYKKNIGDIAIKTVADTMLDLVGADDVVVRFGGEEFIIIMPDCTEEQLEQLAQQIRTVFAQQQIQANSETFTKTLSIGTSMFPNDRPSFWKYIKQCDIALYKAKQTGRDKVVRFSEDMK